MKSRNRPPSQSEVLEQYPELSRQIEKLFAAFADRSDVERKALELAFARYFEEGLEDSYQAYPEMLILKLLAENLLPENGTLVDLGCGPGNLLYSLEVLTPSLNLIGVDLSPGFVKRFNCDRIVLSEVFMRLGIIDSPLDMEDYPMDASVISVLTLDRLSQPKQLVCNMAEFSGRKFLGTLLPVVGEDDNPSRQGENKIVYTPPDNRIVPGRNEEEDRTLLSDFLAETWDSEIGFFNVPYSVGSSNDVQVYDLALFYSADDTSS